MQKLVGSCVAIAAITLSPIPANAQWQNQSLVSRSKTFNCLTKEVWTTSKTLWCQQLLNTEWLLEDLNGRGIIDNLQSTLKFSQPNEISGQGGCNRYTATLKTAETKTNLELLIQVGEIASTFKFCSPAVNDQEKKILSCYREIGATQT